MTNIDYENTLMYEFDGADEFTKYCDVFKDQIGKKQVIWSKGTDYADLFKKGFSLNEKKQYSKAIKVLEQALNFNPIGLGARFEMVESYIALKDYDKAKEKILEMKDILINDSLIARFYRRLGFIFTEESKYELAYACFSKSKMYEDTEQANQEIAYILTKANIDRRLSIDKLLKENNIPVLNKLNKKVDTTNSDNNHFEQNTKTSNTEKDSAKTKDVDIDVKKTNDDFEEHFCRKCGIKLNSDEDYCHKCATKVIKDFNYKSFPKIKKCNKCGEKLPLDSLYCVNCGSNSIIEESTKEENKPTEANDKKNYKTPFIIALVIATLLGIGLLSASSELTSYKNEIIEKDKKISDKDKEISSLKTKVQTAQNSASSYQTKAGYFDKIKSSANKSSNTNFFVSNTVLLNPNKTRVVFYIANSSRYNISWEYDNGITITSGNTSSGLVYIDVTYTGSGVKTITCTNSVNSQKITIYCIGS